MDSSKVARGPFSNAGRQDTTQSSPATTTIPDSPSRVIGGEDRRRSQRVLLRVRAKVHVALQGTPTTFEVTTLSVNSYGALIALQQNLPTDTRLVLEHTATRERMPCKVVRPPRETSEGFHTAIEFDSAAADFWRIAFPPADWRPEDS
jgi:hypothetical protein